MFQTRTVNKVYFLVLSPIMLRTCIRLLSSNKMLGFTCAAKLHTNCGRALYSFNKDLPNPEIQTRLSKLHSHDSNILLDEISKAKTLDNILELFSNHQESIKSHQIVAFLKRLHNLSKEQRLDPKTITENETFQSICSHLMKQVKSLEPLEIITTYQVLTSFGIRNNSYVMQSVLRRIGKQVNVLDVEQLALLYSIVSKQRHNHLVDDLKMSLPLLLQVRIDRLLASEDVSKVVSCLHLAYRCRLKPVTVQKIVSSILTRSETLTPTNATTVISALVHIDTPVDGYRQLLDSSFDVLARNIESLDQDQVLNLLKLCQDKVLHQDNLFYKVTKKAVSERWCLKNTQQVVKVFDSMKFSSPELTSYCVSVTSLERTAKVV